MRLNQRTVYKDSIPLDTKELFYQVRTGPNNTIVIQKRNTKNAFRYSNDVIFDTDELTEDIIDNSSKDQFNYMMREKSIENLNLVLQTLTAREERILRLYYIEDMNDTEIAKLFSLCRQRIYDIRQRSLCKLRHSSRSDLLKDFLKVA